MVFFILLSLSFDFFGEDIVVCGNIHRVIVFAVCGWQIVNENKQHGKSHNGCWIADGVGLIFVSIFMWCLMFI